jgi:hypothetical protein
VCDVAWISHQLIDDSQSRVGRISEGVEAAVSAAKPVAGVADPGGLLNRSQVSTTACHAVAHLNVRDQMQLLRDLPAHLKI